ncbi:DUF2142 domain-containing protein [Lactococcus allomyrinae]|uniref:DUF2142 domain-containing protein n=1 Tax=Lactococcus allomyrinae TaxID=2419773 RepID=A0A387BKT3_9LACT|nr:DUF2142 domain-containing protein [Lactococcus allomyrinae]AYG01570.1 DUF2142 domain-containing protein [Lactococcus allomyrinae]
MNFLKNTGKELLKNRWWMLAFFLILILSQFAIQYRPLIIPKKYLFIVIVAMLLLFSLTRLREIKKLPLNTFLIIMILGTVNTLVLPVRQELDENTHFFYAVQIADGQFFKRDFNQMKFLQMSPNFLEITQLPSKPEYGSKTNTNLYSREFLRLKNQKNDYSHAGPITGIANPVYYPSALGIALGRFISPYLFVSYYLGRVFNLLMYALLAFFAVKKSKRYQLPLFVVAFLPYTLWITAGYNYDALYYGVILLFLSQLTNLFTEEKGISLKQMVRISLTGLLLVFCKAPMALLIILPFFLPKKVFASNKVRLQALGMLAFSSALIFAWVKQGMILEKLRLIFGRTLPDTAGGAGGNVGRVDYFLTHPLYTVTTGLRTVFDIPSTIKDSIASPQPFLNKIYSSGAVELFNILLVALLFVLVSLQLDFQVSKRIKIVTIVLFGAITAGIIYAISGDSRVFHIGDLTVAGVQGRYHFYILAFLPIFLEKPVKKIFDRKMVGSERTNDFNIQKFVVSAVLVMTFVNTCIGLFGYL